MTIEKLPWLRKLETITRSYLEYLLLEEDQALQEIDLFLNNRQSLLNIIGRVEKRITNPDKLNKISEHSGIPSRVAAMDEQILRILARARKESGERLARLSAGQRALRGYRNGGEPKRG